ncbi:MAG TPA: carbohydrate-binding family 9-like protein [Armatimonadota bacterium]|jgi:hypothetical protein
MRGYAHYRLLLLLLCLLAALECLAAQSPRYTCEKIDRELKVTGKLDDPLWRRAQVVTLRDATTGKAAAKETTLRLLYNNAYLYVGFSCADDFVWGTQTERDSPIFTEECVECFLSPTGMERVYYELDLSPRNVVFDAAVLNGKQNMQDWQKLLAFPTYECTGLITKTAINGALDTAGATGWSAEYAIPFTSLIGRNYSTPKRGDLWRANFYRIDSRAPGAGQKVAQDFFAWSPPGAPNFHLPWMFGWVVFK